MAEGSWMNDCTQGVTDWPMVMACVTTRVISMERGVRTSRIMPRIVRIEEKVSFPPSLSVRAWWIGMTVAEKSPAMKIAIKKPWIMVRKRPEIKSTRQKSVALEIISLFMSIRL